MSDDASTPIRVRLTQANDYAFDLDFGAGQPLVRADEGPPVGQGAGPSPVQLLAASVGNCLSASLLFALRKFKQSPEPIGCEVLARLGRNEQKRLRVQTLEVTLTLGVPAASLAHLERVLASFEDFCTVTQSVRTAIEVRVRVLDALGVELKPA
jgi:uncharacterized OsmC-like protein